jgi:dihydrofolate reductase
MGTITVQTFITLDGVLQAPGGRDEDRESGFDHGGWQFPFADEAAGARIFAGYERAEAILLGRRTYEIFASYWPTANPDNPFTQRINALPRYVASTTLADGSAWPGTTVVRDAQEIAALKERHADVIVPGSGDLIQTLLRERLADRLELYLHPVALGSGKRIFEDGTVPAAYTLETSEAFPSGAVLLSYAAAGEPTYGDMSDLD